MSQPGRRHPVRHPRQQQPDDHVDPLDGAAEQVEPPGVVAAHRRGREPGEHRRPVLDVGEERVRTHPAGVLLALGQGVPRGVEALPHLAGDHLAGAAGVLPRPRDRRDDGARLLVGVADELGDRPRVERARRPADRSRARRAGCGRRGRCRRWRPRAAGAPRRRGCGPCRRRARRSARSSTATRRCGRASASLPAAVAAVAAGWCSARGPSRRRASWRGRPRPAPSPPARARPRAPGRRRAPRCPCCRRPGWS